MENKTLIIGKVITLSAFYTSNSTSRRISISKRTADVVISYQNNTGTCCFSEDAGVSEESASLQDHTLQIDTYSIKQC